MPILIPTADEIQRMDARARAAWNKRLGTVMHQMNQTRHAADIGGEVRRQAYLWFQLLGPDPDAEQHRAELLEAIA